MFPALTQKDDKEEDSGEEEEAVSEEVADGKKRKLAVETPLGLSLDSVGLIGVKMTSDG